MLKILRDCGLFYVPISELGKIEKSRICDRGGLLAALIAFIDI